MPTYIITVPEPERHGQTDRQTDRRHTVAKYASSCWKFPVVCLPKLRKLVDSKRTFCSRRKKGVVTKSPNPAVIIKPMSYRQPFASQGRWWQQLEHIVRPLVPKEPEHCRQPWLGVEEHRSVRRYHRRTFPGIPSQRTCRVCTAQTPPRTDCPISTNKREIFFYLTVDTVTLMQQIYEN